MHFSQLIFLHSAPGAWLLPFALLSFIVAGCGKGAPGVSNDDNIIGVAGKWNLKYGCTLYYLNNELEARRNSVGYTSGSFLEFRSDGSYRIRLKSANDPEFCNESGKYTRLSLLLLFDTGKFSHADEVMIKTMSANTPEL